jgi:hypothetical protein
MMMMCVQFPKKWSLTGAAMREGFSDAQRNVTSKVSVRR